MGADNSDLIRHWREVFVRSAPHARMRVDGIRPLFDALEAAEEMAEIRVDAQKSVVDQLWERLKAAEARNAELVAELASLHEAYDHRVFFDADELEAAEARADAAEADAALGWYWVDVLDDNTTCGEQRDRLHADQAAHRARITPPETT